MSSKKPLVVACIPAYNEERAIGAVVMRTLKHVDKVLVCDDGSDDLTGAIAAGLGADIIRHESNSGYGASLRSLFQEARRLGADMVVTLDGDGQHNPEEIPRLVDRLGAGDVDIVIGSRFMEGRGEDVSRLRKAGIKVITGLASNVGPQFSDAQSGFRAYSKRALESLVLTEHGMGVSTEILLKANRAGLKVVEVPVKISYENKESGLKGFVQGIEVVGSTIKHLSIQHPMRFYGILAAIFFFIGLTFGIWALEIFWVEGRLVTNITLISIASTIVSLIFFMMAVLLYTLISILRERR